MLSSTAVALLASGLVASVSASNAHAHHQNLHKKEAPSSWPAPSAANATCGCTTYTTTWYGEASLVPAPWTSTSSSSAAPTTTSKTSSVSTSSTSSSSSSSSTSTSTSSTSTSTSISTSTSTSTSSSSSSTSSSTWVAPTTSSSTWVAPTTSSSTETTPTSTWVAPTSTWTPEAPSSTWVAPTTSETSTWVAPTSSWSEPSSSAAAKNWVANIQSISIPSASLPAWGAASSSATPSSSSGSSSGGGKSAISANGNKWAMTYTPYNNDGSCKSASDVSSDIASIKGKGFTTVRLYATDCSGPQNVGTAARSVGLKIILGIYIDGSGIGDNAYAQVSTLTSWGSSGNWDLVEMVVAGNEAIFNGYTSASALATFITDVKGKFKSAGFSGPVTTTEPLGTIQTNSGTICPVVDVIAANIHPFFNGGISAANAGSFVSSQLSDLAKACNNQKEAYNLETGWPWKGNNNGDAWPGVADQVTAINGIIAAAGSKSAIFSFENDGWKAPGSLNVEQYWGCGGLF